MIRSTDFPGLPAFFPPFFSMATNMQASADTQGGGFLMGQKLRKPAVEKLRRDRINSSIEQLKMLLKDELKTRQPSSKLEKADILEMAVTYLKSKTPGQSYHDGFAQCLEETARFLSAHNQLTTEPPAETRHFVRAQKPKAKLRKPAVEKLRRDRINSSIEQLKMLLKDELKTRQPSSKLEKADILEMAVTYLKSKTPGQSYHDGFARCLEETARFLSAHNQLTTEPPAEPRHFVRAQKPKAKVKSVSSGQKSISGVPTSAGASSPLWRPWFSITTRGHSFTSHGFLIGPGVFWIDGGPQKAT
ncbi:hypothetical protein NFI96_004899 [Prochilodus magdalenae]|nr:hypothetical protein NFI96_004899 [Prochilodus magdalenae]